MSARTAFSAAWFVCVLSAGPWPAAAQAPAPPAQAGAPEAVQSDPFQSRVAQAAQLLEADPQAAVEILDHLAVQSIEARKVRALLAAERPAHRQLFTMRARAHLELMNNQLVEESLRELLRVDPYFTSGLPPRAQEILDGIRTKESGLLEVTSSVRDCRVLVDGLEVGVTGDLPVRVSLVAGSYQLRLEKPGHQGAGARLTMVAAQTLTVSDLTPKAQIPPVAFLVDRADVEVLVDNARGGTTALLADLRGRLTGEEAAALDQAVTMARFDPRTTAGFILRDPPVDRSVVVRFRGDCLVDETRTVSFTADALAGLDPTAPLVWFGEQSAVRMLPDVGTLRVTSVPKDADVFVDGQLAGRTPFERGVCTGDHRVRLRHRIGSYGVTASISRGRTEVIDVTLRPGLGFLGAVEAFAGASRPAPELAAAADRALASAVTTFRLTAPTDVPPEVVPWSDAANADLVAAADRGDADRVRRLLRQAADNFDAPLLIAVAARGPAAAADVPVDVLLFWFEHEGVDRVRLPRATAETLTQAFESLDRPAEAEALIRGNVIGLRLADSLLSEAPLAVVAVDSGSAAALAGIRPGDVVQTVDGQTMSAAQVRQAVAQKRPGDLVNLVVTGQAGPSRRVALPVQRLAVRGQVFSPAVFGNAVLAKLEVALAGSPSAADRDLLAFTQGLVRMRFGQWRLALDVFERLSQVPPGPGVGPGAALYFRARCHEALGERDRAVALLREAAAAETQPLADDGMSVGAIARARLAMLGDAPVAK